MLRGPDVGEKDMEGNGNRLLYGFSSGPKFDELIQFAGVSQLARIWTITGDNDGHAFPVAEVLMPRF